ncbi:hypothetical protein MOQ72_37130 [Saccharopolyspora sp. K220]|uniref:hypothetical protein n=1 Tax=Saccharopolyspora soli TaxID=2926618 RepID=UPI001F5AE686|nr:hypothetical protein [Saccharopolyspora soli]MCI2423056.1 hypothetical protein [Saccharopolyspora soli]
MDALQQILTSIYDRTDEIWYETFARLARGNGVVAAQDMIAVVATEVQEGHWRPTKTDVDAWANRYAAEHGEN